MSDLKDRVEFYIDFMEKRAAEEEGKPRDPFSYVNGLDKGYAGAFSLAAKWLREAVEASEDE